MDLYLIGAANSVLKRSSLEDIRAVWHDWILQSGSLIARVTYFEVTRKKLKIKD
jgi:hypothetical protein